MSDVIGLGFLAIDGAEWDSKHCECDREVGACPCRYCAIHRALTHATELRKDLAQENKMAFAYKAERDQWRECAERLNSITTLCRELLRQVSTLANINGATRELLIQAGDALNLQITTFNKLKGN